MVGTVCSWTTRMVSIQVSVFRGVVEVGGDGVSGWWRVGYHPVPAEQGVADRAQDFDAVLAAVEVQPQMRYPVTGGLFVAESSGDLLLCLGWAQVVLGLVRGGGCGQVDHTRRPMSRTDTPGRSSRTWMHTVDRWLRSLRRCAVVVDGGMGD